MFKAVASVVLSVADIEAAAGWYLEWLAAAADPDGMVHRIEPGPS